jgi:hypothetical protein
VIYREKYEADLYEERYRNIVIRQQSMYGPRFVMGLGTILALFVAYLIYSNVLSSPVTLLSPERSLWVIANPTTVFPAELHDFADRTILKPGVADTIVPHSRATDALLGGQGPAAISSQAITAQHGPPHIMADKRELPR